MPTTEVLERRINAAMATRAVSTVPTSWNAEARTIDVVWTTGARGARFDWTRWEFVDEELATDSGSVRLDRLNGGAPVLNTHQQHDLENQIGVVVPGSARMEGGQGLATLQLSERADIADVVADIAAGIIRNLSVGYLVHTYEVTEKDGQRALYRAVDWEPTEISFVPVPFEAGAQTRSHNDQNTGQGGFPCIIKETRTMPDIAPAAGAALTPATEPQGQAPAAGQNRQQPNPTPPVEPATTVTRFTATTALAFVEQARAFGDACVARANELIAQNELGEVSVETARSQILAAAADAQRGQTGAIRSAPRTEVTRDERDKFIEGATASLVVRAGMADMFRAAAKARGETIDLDPGEFRGLRNVELARMSLDRAGIRVDSYDRNEVVAAALTTRAAGSMTTSDFPNLLENVMHKTLQAAYQTAPDTWRRFCGVGSVTDFRAHNRYLRGMFGSLDDKNEAGEFKNKAIPDAAKESISASTKGNIVSLTREAIVNDDLSAFSMITVELGRAAMLTIEKAVYALLNLNNGLGPDMNDGKSLFHADHANIASTPGAPSVSTIDAIRQLVASQRDVSGEEVLDLVPRIFLGPLSLGGAARVTNFSEYDPDTENKLQRFNVAKGLFSDIVDTARLSGTRWYAFTDPSVAPAIEVVFLDGQQEPYTEMRQGWRTDGTEWKVRHDFGVGGVNWRSAATNAGA